MFTTFSIYLVFFFNICCVFCDGQLKVGTECTLPGNIGKGQCVPLAQCPEALMRVHFDDNSRQCRRLETCCGKPKIVEKIGVQRVEKISEQKCWEYGESVYAWESPPTFGFIKEPPINVSKCEFDAKSLIIGGEDADSKEFPHMALLGYGPSESTRSWCCGGSLISPQFVLTAGHCLVERELGGVKWIRLGELKISSRTDASPVDFSVVEKIPHPNYKPPSRYNDIALLKMDRAVVFNEHIRPACLNTVFETHSKYIATGWGFTSEDDDTITDHLQKVTLEAFSQDQCNTSYKSLMSERLLKIGIDPESQICAGSFTSNKDTCKGDSGGPLQIFHPKVHCMYSIMGVTSFGKKCGTQRSPAVYTRVSNYIDWIEKTVWPQG